MLHKNTAQRNCNAANSNYSGSANESKNDRGSGRTNVSELSWKDLRAYAKSLGISTYQKKRTEIENEIAEVLASEYGYSENDSDAVKALKRLGFRETDFHIDNEFPPKYRGEWQGIKFYSDRPCTLQAMGEGQGWELNLKNCEWDFECWKQLFNQSLETGEAPTSEEINGVFFQEFSNEEIAAACDRFTSAKSNQLNRDGQILELILDYAHFEISPEWLKHQLKREFTPSIFDIIDEDDWLDMEVIRFWQVGDFIETFGDEAETLSDISGLALINTTTTAGRIPKSGFPTYAFDRYAAWLAQRGYKAELSPNNPDILSEEWWREFVGEPPAAPAPAPSEEPEEEDSLLSEVKDKFAFLNEDKVDRLTCAERLLVVEAEIRDDLDDDYDDLPFIERVSLVRDRLSAYCRDGEQWLKKDWCRILQQTPAPAPELSEPEESEKDSLLSESDELTALATNKTENTIDQLSVEGQGIDSLIRKLRIEKYFDADEQKAAILQQTIDKLEAKAQNIQEKIESLSPKFDFEDEKFNLSWQDVRQEIKVTQIPFKTTQHEWVKNGELGIIATKHYRIYRNQFPSLRPAQLGNRLGIEYGRLQGFEYHCAGKTDWQRYNNSFTEKPIWEFQVERPYRGDYWLVSISDLQSFTSSPKVVPLQPAPVQPAPAPVQPAPQRRTRPRPTPPYKPAARKPDIEISGKGKFWLTKESVIGDRAEYQIVREKPDGYGWSTHRLLSHPHGISCDCKGFSYHGYCCHLKALSEILKPEMEVFEERSYLLEIIRTNKFWDLLDLVKPSILNQTVAEVAEGNKALKNALALREVQIT